jgi:hypothetical protein
MLDTQYIDTLSDHQLEYSKKPWRVASLVLYCARVVQGSTCTTSTTSMADRMRLRVSKNASTSTLDYTTTTATGESTHNINTPIIVLDHIPYSYFTKELSYSTS